MYHSAARAAAGPTISLSLPLPILKRAKALPQPACAAWRREIQSMPQRPASPAGVAEADLQRATCEELTTVGGSGRQRSEPVQ